MAKFRTPFPDHAKEELKTPEGRKFWEAWAAVGDAKLGASDAFQAVADAEQEFGACLQAALIQQRPLDNGCGCGAHASKVRSLRAGYDSTRGTVQDAVTKFKRGG